MNGFGCGNCEHLIQGKEPLPKWWYCKKYEVFLNTQPRMYLETATRINECVQEERGNIMKNKITIQEAKEKGYIVDTTVYPHFGYKGARFMPTEDSVEIYTELETELREGLQEAVDLIEGILEEEETLNSPISVLTTQPWKKVLENC